MNIKPLTAPIAAALIVAGVCLTAPSAATAQTVSVPTATIAAVATDSVTSAIAQTAELANAVDNVGFVYVGPIGDHGWSYRHDVGRQAIEKELGVKTTFVESVPEGADAERVIRKLATSGHDIIFTTSFGYMQPTAKIAKQFPDIKFEHATGFVRDDNLSTYSARFYEGRAVLGTIAGHLSKSGVVGYIASFPIPEVVRGINAFTLAMQKVNPDAVVKVVWVNSWYDPGKEGDAAKALIDQGADIITQHTDSPAPLQVAEKRGVHAFGQASDMSAFAPNAQLTAIIDDWDHYYISKVKAAMEGTWTSTDTWGGIKSGMVDFAPYGDAVSAEVRVAADAVKQSIIDGSFHPFQGPINNQEGALVVAQGETLGDDVLLGMDWYVEGVQGGLGR